MGRKGEKGWREGVQSLLCQGKDGQREQGSGEKEEKGERKDGEKESKACFVRERMGSESKDEEKEKGRK